MTYRIIRIDGKNDELTAQSFDKYSDAYDLLEELYGDLCCSDADYGDITYYDIVENNLKNIKWRIKKWAPSQEENLGVITSVYDFIKEELSELQKKTGCPDSFIMILLARFRMKWHPESCHSIVRNKKRKN